MSNQPPYLPTALGASKATLLLGNNPSSGPYAGQLPQCTITSNPYSGGGYTGATGTYGLFNCIAIQNGAISVVVWFYLPPGSVGPLLSFQTVSYPNTPSNGWTPIMYIDSNGLIHMGDCCGVTTVSAPVSPGWHIAVFEEWASSTTGPYYIAGYLDGNYLGQQQLSLYGQIFGIQYGPFPYNYIGSGYGGGWPNYPTSGWAFFNGAIAYVALYNRVLTTSDVLAIYQGVRITSGLVAEYVGNNYSSSTGVWTDSSGNNYNITTTVVAGQYSPRGCTLWPVGDSGNWINWPTC